MDLTLIDWLIIVAYTAMALGIGLAFSKRAGGGLCRAGLDGPRLPGQPARRELFRLRRQSGGHDGGF